MHPVLEVSGEANPLSRPTLLNVLISASSNSQIQVQTGTQQLQNWEKEEGYFTLLQDIATDYSAPIEARYLSILQLKNGVDKYWRKSSPYALKPDVKQQIKLRALESGVREPSPQLALHNALMISKILRYEFPTEWSDVFTKIIELLRYNLEPGSNSFQLSRTLLILLQAVKELSTARLQRIRKGFQSMAPEAFHALANIYVQKVESISHALKGTTANGAGDIENAEQCLAVLKIIRRLILSGYTNPHRDAAIQQFWELTLSHFATFVNFSKQKRLSSDQSFVTLVEKFAIQLSKLHLSMISSHPGAVSLLPQSIDMVKFYWSLVVELGESYGPTDFSKMQIGTDGDADNEEKSILDKLGLRGLILLRECATIAFRPTRVFKAEDREERNAAVEAVKTRLLDEQFAILVMEQLVTRFFVFRAIDLREWEEEPEEWEKHEEQISSAWEFSIRPCSEKLFLDLVLNFKSLAPKLLSVFYSYATPHNQDILLKDSLYSAVGLAAAYLEGSLDFNTFLLSTLIPEVQIQQPGYNILRRRTAILLGQWVPIKFGDLDKDAIYRIFQHLLNKDDPTNDQVVRVTAGRQLKAVLDPYEFTAEKFLPFATPIFHALMDLIQEVSLPETKMGLIDTLRVSAVKLEDHISPYADGIVSLLPNLWDQCGNQYLLKQSILSLLSAIICSMKQESVRYHPLVLPLIQQSTEPEADSLVYLLDESLDLWSAVLAQTPSPASSQLLVTFTSLFQVFEIETENIRQAFEIAESYILLAPHAFLDSQIRTRLLTVLEPFIRPTVSRRIGMAPSVASSLIRIGAISTDESEQVYNSIAESFINSSFLRTLLEGLYDAHEATLSSGPNKKRSHVDGVAETDLFSVLARLALANSKVFVSAIRVASRSTSEDPIFAWLMKEWFFHFDSIGDVGTKKLHTLGLTNLLSLNGPSSPPPTYLLNHLQSYLNIWTSLITELSDEGDGSDNRGGDYLVNPNNYSVYEPDRKYQDNEPPETTRRRAWAVADPIHQIHIRTYVTEHIRALVGSCGGIDHFREAWLVNVDKDVVDEFAKLGVF